MTLSSSQRKTGLVGRMILQETAISNAWYEVLSVLHLMAMLSLSQANLLLFPRTSADGYQPKVTEGRCYCIRLLSSFFFVSLCLFLFLYIVFHADEESCGAYVFEI